MTRILLLLALCACLLPGCREEPVSGALQAHLDKYPSIRKKYFYQSVIRVANTSHDPNFEGLIRDLRKVTAYLPPRQDSTYAIAPLRPQLREEGFETLIEARSAEAQRLSLWVKTVDGTDRYLALIEGEQGDMILEVDGRIGVEYIAKLAGTDQEAIRKLVMGQL